MHLRITMHEHKGTGVPYAADIEGLWEADLGVITFSYSYFTET